MLWAMSSRKSIKALIVVMGLDVVADRVGLDPSTITARIAAGTFPKPMHVDGRPVWTQSDINQWISANTAIGGKTLIELTPAHLKLIDALAELVVAEYRREGAITSGHLTTSDDSKGRVRTDASASTPEASAVNGTVFLTFAEVSARTACGRTKIYAGIAAGTFPKPIKAGARSLWVESEVEAWMRERIAERDGEGL